MTLSRRRLALCAVAAVAALALGFLASQLAGPGRSHPVRLTEPRTPPAAAAPAPAPPSTPPAGALAAPPGPGAPPAGAAPPNPALPTSAPTVSFSDRRTGFRLSYPRAWSRLASRDPSVPLLASGHDGVSLLVRAVRLRQPIDGPRLAALRDAAGALIRSRRAVQMIAGPRLLAIANLPGFLYIYSFFDPLSHRRVAHSQIALFAGRKMFTLVFQAARAADLPRFAMLFDKITASFRAS